MTPVSSAPTLSAPVPSGTANRPALPYPASSAFLNLIDQLSLSGKPASQSSALPQSVIQTQQRIQDFERKLALLSGMAEQARIVMNSQEPVPGGAPSPAAQEYYRVKSELARIGLPGIVNDII